jgi:outer membrane protein assembly factor BamB
MDYRVTPRQAACAWLIAVVSLALVAPAAADWTGFRGPKNLGLSAERGLPTEWSGTKNVVWKVKLPGPGSSNPITTGGRIYLTYYTGYGMGPGGDPKELRRHLLALDRKTGNVLWDKEEPGKLPEARYQGQINLHGYASSTPVTDGERIYVFHGKSGVFAYDLDGKQLWQADVGSGTNGWGSGSSPVLYKNLVLVNASIESNSLIALDKQSGKETWRARGVARTWGTPALVDVPGGKPEVVVNAPRTLLGYDPDTGKELWRCEGIPDGYVCTTAVSQNGVVYAIGGRQNTAIAVRAGGRGDVTKTHRLWSKNVGANVTSPVLSEGHLYWVNDRGQAICVKADTGATVYQERLPGSLMAYASPLAADGKLYMVSRESGTYVLAARPKYELLARNQFGDDKSVCNASPAVDQGQLLLRSDQYLYCLGMN